MLDAVELIQRAGLREPRQLSPVQRWNTLGKVFGRTEGAVMPSHGDESAGRPRGLARRFAGGSP
jgi:hypothetical protein